MSLVKVNVSKSKTIFSRRNDVLFGFGQVGGNHFVVGKEESYPDQGQNDVNPRPETWSLLQCKFLSLNSPILKIVPTVYISSLSPQRPEIGGMTMDEPYPQSS